VRVERARDRFMPWAGLALGTLGYFIAHQLGSDWAFFDCTVGNPWAVTAGTIIALGLIGGGAFASWRVLDGSGERTARRLIAAVSLMASALFAIGVLLPLAAALIIPQCWS
jgi:hypothetical protein